MSELTFNEADKSAFDKLIYHGIGCGKTVACVNIVEGLKRIKVTYYNDGKIYIGDCEDTGGSKVAYVYSNEPIDSVVESFMLKHGINNVEGGSYANENLTNEQRSKLIEMGCEIKAPKI